jgi:hypothetical protein
MSNGFFAVFEVLKVGLEDLPKIQIGPGILAAGCRRGIPRYHAPQAGFSHSAT